MNAQIRQQRDIVTGAEVEVGRRSLEKVSLQDGGGASSQTPKGQAALGSNRADGARDEAGKWGKDKKNGVSAAPAVPAVPAEPPAAEADDETAADGWLLSCDAGKPPEQVTAALRRYLDGLELVVIDLEPSVWVDEAAFSRRLREVLGLRGGEGEPVDLGSAAAAAALEQLCAQDTLLLLRPRKWQPKRSIEMAGRLLDAVERAFDRVTAGKEVAAVLFGWRGNMKVEDPPMSGKMREMKVHPLTELEPTSSAPSSSPPAPPADTTPAALPAATSPEGAGGAPGAEAGAGGATTRAAAAAAAATAAAASAAATAAATAAAADAAEEEGSAWLFSCAPGTPVATLFEGLGLDASTRVLELNTADLRYATNEQLRAEGSFLLALAEHGGVTAPPVAAEGQFWPTARGLLASAAGRQSRPGLSYRCTPARGLASAEARAPRHALAPLAPACSRDKEPPPLPHVHPTGVAPRARHAHRAARRLAASAAQPARGQPRRAALRRAAPRALREARLRRRDGLGKGGRGGGGRSRERGGLGRHPHHPGHVD